MPHNGIDIDQFILLTIYPTAAFFVLGFLRKKFRFSEVLTVRITRRNMYSIFNCIFYINSSWRCTGFGNSTINVWNIITIYGQKKYNSSDITMSPLCHAFNCFLLRYSINPII